MKIFKRTIVALISFSLIVFFSYETFASINTPNRISSSTVNHLEQSLKHLKKNKPKQALHLIKKSGNRHAIDYISWKIFLKGYSSNNFYDIADFVLARPNWPKSRGIKKRAAEAMDATVNVEDGLRWFYQFPPESGIGKKKLAELYIEANHNLDQPRYSQKRINQLLKDAWVHGNFRTHDERDFINRHSKRLNTKDHIARIERLLWNDRTSAAERILHKVPSNYRKLYTARIRLIKNSYGIDKAIKAVPKNFKNDAGLVFNRMMWRHKRNNERGTIEKLEKLVRIPNQPYAHQWWKILDYHIRELVEAKQYAKAYGLARKHRQTEKKPLSEAEWLAGWISLRHLNDPKTSYKHFRTMYETVEFPISKSKASYWMGRALEADGKLEQAHKMYNESAKFFNTFYGQQSLTKLHHVGHRVTLQGYPSITFKDHASYARNQLVKIVPLLTKTKQLSDARLFVRQAIANAQTEGEVALISNIGKQINSPYISVVASKKALQQNIIMWGALYPIINEPRIKHAPPELVMSIIRQESLFNQNAKSHAGAVGIMQLMPATARYASKKLRLHYSKRRLHNNPHYNIKLGSYYISNLMKKYDNSLILAVASYNAGEGNINRWMKSMGDPREFQYRDAVIDWLEFIPFRETRNYVQRVIESRKVYEVMLDDRSALRQHIQQFNFNATLRQGTS